MDQKQFARLVERSRSGDRSAQEDLIAAVQNFVYFHCCRLLEHRENALDVTQDVLIAMVTGLPDLREPAAFRAWLLKIIYNRCRNYRSRGPKECQIPETPEGDTILDTWAEDDVHTIPHEAMDHAETARILRELVDGLTPEQRACVLLYYYDELKIPEIAAILSLPETTVKSRLHHARKALKEGVEDYERRSGKLYALSLGPMLLYFFHSEAHAGTLPAASSTALTATALSAAEGGAGSAAAATAAATAAGTAVKIVACVAAVGMILGGLWMMRDLRKTKPPEVEENHIEEQNAPADSLKTYLLDTVLQPAEWAVPNNGFTFDTPEDLSSEALLRLYLLWEDPEKLESCWQEDSYWLTDEIIRPVLDEHFRSYTFDLTQCMHYDIYSEAVRLASLPERTGTRDMVITDCQSSGSTVTVTVDFRGRCSWELQPETVLYQRKVYEVALETNGFYYLSAKEVPLDPEEVTAPQLGSGADAPVFTQADMDFAGEPFPALGKTTPEALDQQFGPVEDVKSELVHEANGFSWETRVYDGISITCNRQADGSDYSVGMITYERPDLPYVRDIRVGDSLETLLSTYRSEAWLYVPDEIEGYYCVSLYGTPIHMGTFGLLEYRDGRPYDVMYQEGGAGVRFYLDEDCTISSIELFGGLYW